MERTFHALSTEHLVLSQAGGFRGSDTPIPKTHTSHTHAVQCSAHHSP
jgi:hypothetical protein